MTGADDAGVLPALILLQWDLAWENPARNRDRVLRFLESSPPPAGSLVVLPEMWGTGFSMNALAAAEPPGNAHEAWMAGTARQHGIHLMGGTATRADGVARNEALAFDPAGQLVARYAKRRLFPPAGEPDHASPGTQARVFSWGPWTVSPFLCYDLRFPSLFQEAVGMGADLLIVMANWPGPRTSHWEILLRARAVEAQCVVAGVNRCGSDPLLAYAGASLVADQSGHIIASAGQGEGLVACRPDHEGVTGWRASFPAWKTYTTTLRG